MALVTIPAEDIVGLQVEVGFIATSNELFFPYAHAGLEN